jgi:hypothetical protein
MLANCESDLIRLLRKLKQNVVKLGQNESEVRKLPLKFRESSFNFNQDMLKLQKDGSH